MFLNVQQMFLPTIFFGIYELSDYFQPKSKHSLKNQVVWITIFSSILNHFQQKGNPLSWNVWKKKVCVSGGGGGGERISSTILFNVQEMFLQNHCFRNIIRSQTIFIRNQNIYKKIQLSGWQFSLAESNLEGLLFPCSDSYFESEISSY